MRYKDRDMVEVGGLVHEMPVFDQADNVNQLLRNIVRYLTWKLRGEPPYRVWERPELLETLLKRADEQKELNRKEHIELQKTLANYPIDTGDVATDMYNGVMRQKYLILSNLGINFDVGQSYLIYALENDVSFELSGEDKRKAFQEHAINSLNYDMEEEK